MRNVDMARLAGSIYAHENKEKDFLIDKMHCLFIDKKLHTL